LNANFVFLEAYSRVVDEGLVVQTGLDDLAADRVRQGNIRADVEAQPGVRPLGRCRATRVDSIEAGALVQGLEDVVEEDRVRLAGVRAPEDDQVGILDLLVRAGAAPGPENCRQTDDAGG